MHATDDVEALLRYLTYIFEASKHKRHTNWCLDVDKSTNARQWFYQTCNEFGWFTTSHYHFHNISTENRLFFPHLVPLSYFYDLCLVVFGGTFTSNRMALNEEQTNAYFRGKWQSTSDNLLNTHGQLDPRRIVGPPPGQNIMIITEITHTKELGSIGLKDSVALNVHKVKVAGFFNKFLINNQNIFT